MLTCKEFLQELSDFLDDSVDADLRRRLEMHVTACPNCWVVCDTTQKTIQIYKGVEPQKLPDDVQKRLMLALERKALAAKPRA